MVLNRRDVKMSDTWERDRTQLAPTGVGLGQFSKRRLHVYCGFLSSSSDCNTQVHYGCSPDLPLSLGAGRTAARACGRWPDGTATTTNTTPVNRQNNETVFAKTTQAFSCSMFIIIVTLSLKAPNNWDV